MEPCFWTGDDLVVPEPAAKKTRRKKEGGAFVFPFSANAQPRAISSNMITTDSWMARLQVTQTQADEIARLQQGSPEWLQSRVGRITASNFGAAMGINKYLSRNGLLRQLLWGGFTGNVATRWGQDHEDIARDEYIRIKAEVCGRDNVSVRETGLVINPERPWMGNSPDGIITLEQEEGLLEIKCPFKQTFYSPDPVPDYYYAQIQGTMGNLGLPWCDFVVWTPNGTQVTRVEFDQPYWENQLLPKVTEFYFQLYLPLAIHKENGTLQHGSITIPA